jgi:hypothetical protein
VLERIAFSDDQQPRGIPARRRLMRDQLGR